MANLSTSNLPYILQNQEELKRMMKELLENQHNQHQIQQNELQHNVREEIADLKRLILELENEKQQKQQADCGANEETKSNEEPFQKIFVKHFTNEILSSYYGDITSHICALIRDVVKQRGDDEYLTEELICEDFETFNCIRNYLEFMFTKQIPSKDKLAYFENDVISDAVKKQTAFKETIRKEWCDLVRRYVAFIVETVTDKQTRKWMCSDRTLNEMYLEIAKFLNQSMFYGKTLLVHKDYSGSILGSVNFPSTSCILRDIKSRVCKNKGNFKHYHSVVKVSRRIKKKHSSSFESEEEEDEYKETTSTSHINSDGEVFDLNVKKRRSHTTAISTLIYKFKDEFVKELELKQSFSNASTKANKRSFKQQEDQNIKFKQPPQHNNTTQLAATTSSIIKRDEAKDQDNNTQNNGNAELLNRMLNLLDRPDDDEDNDNGTRKSNGRKHPRKMI